MSSRRVSTIWWMPKTRLPLQLLHPYPYCGLVKKFRIVSYGEFLLEKRHCTVCVRLTLDVHLDVCLSVRPLMHGERVSKICLLCHWATLINSSSRRAGDVSVSPNGPPSLSQYRFKFWPCELVSDFVRSFVGVFFFCGVVSFFAVSFRFGLISNFYSVFEFFFVRFCFIYVWRRKLFNARWNAFLCNAEIDETKIK